MIISQTPLRISLFGGGTDFREFIPTHGGAVLSMGIDKSIYVIVKDRCDTDIYINYSRKEIVNEVDQIQHTLVREALRKSHIINGIEITTLADIPSEGSGLGSSSCVTVGLLNALYAHTGTQIPAEQLAREACEIEIDILRKPIGIQDQTIAAHGNMCFLEFNPDGSIIVSRNLATPTVKRQLTERLMLFFTNRTRSADTILKEQRQNIAARSKELLLLRDQAYRAKGYLAEGDLDAIGLMLGEAWETKKALASGVTDPQIDGMYSAALGAGALGGKVAGAGGGGFLLLYVRPENQEKVRQALASYQEMPFGLGRDGSKIVFNINN